MSKELVLAAQRGDLAEVKRLLADPKVDINFVNTTPDYPVDAHFTALAKAVIENKPDVVLYLLERGAVTESSDSYYYCSKAFKTALSLTVHDSEHPSSDLKIFKPLLRATPNINHQFNGWRGYGSLVNDLIVKCKFTDKQTRINLFFHEAVLRNDTKTIDEMLSLKANVKFDLQSLNEYISDIQLSPGEVFKACQGVDYLMNQHKFMLQETCAQMKKVFDKRTLFKLELDAFPEELKPSLQKKSGRSLTELFAELQYWLYPEENLPMVSVDSDAFKNSMDDYEKSPKVIRGYQDLKNLQLFLSLDQTEILMRLNACSNELNENPAALLLAEILLFYKNEKLNDGLPLLTEQQQKTCLYMLKKLYTLTDVEKILLTSVRKQNQTIQELHNKVDTMTGILEALAAKLLPKEEKNQSSPRFKFKV